MDLQVRDSVKSVGFWGLEFFMVWFRVWVLGFCVMTCFNGMVEFLVILVNGQMMGFGKL